ncbi:SigE family RNA polymerase sigma factor [Amycolatopsis cynarae]|uniref:RNA polymerase sigma factor n=1 Tax=Amycolatopsis cynarae TaxID=2995223 RepID=A0ABY7B3L1_9PSEU|nr:SigE family RNA polymerase sigma factor [Amycolatopsis sp. HUAS 11-8]WAL66911.1 SigE family RNA polymerase sigma factor [Amycolatopsis sp. HUAS 11-8]
MRSRDDEFAEFFTARFDFARRIAYSLCRDWDEAEEIAQAAFVRIYSRWPRVRRDGADAYLRMVVTRGFLDNHRRGRARERAVAEPPDRPAPTEAPGGEPLAEALRRVPPKQRAVLVLRFVQDLSVEQTAETLGCSTGNVKSQTMRGLHTLRAAYQELTGEPLAAMRKG